MALSGSAVLGQDKVPSRQALRQELLPVYDSLRSDVRYLDLVRQLRGNLHRAEVVDRYLEYLPMSPLEMLEIKMWPTATSRPISASSPRNTRESSDPALTWNDQGEVFLEYMLLCFVDPEAYHYSVVVAKSADGGATWNAQGVVADSWHTADLKEDKNFYAIDRHRGGGAVGACVQVQ